MMFFLVVTVLVQGSIGPSLRTSEIGPLKDRHACELVARSPMIRVMGGEVVEARCIERVDL
jgi:hypothetical protein